MKFADFFKSHWLIIVVLITGCSSQSQVPDFTASGYLADRGAVRIWRKDQQQHISHLMTVFNPFNADATETADYSWQDGKLVSIERHIQGAHPEGVTLRFDQNGNLSFMQRQREGRREALTPDTIELDKFNAQRMLKISDALLTGRVQLKQGVWLGHDAVKTCQGEVVKADLDNTALHYIAQRQGSARKPVNVAWLEAPEGTQLLLVTRDDDCQWEPKDDDF